MRKLFPNRSRELEDAIDAYIESITQAGLIYQEGIRDYVTGRETAFENRVAEMSEVEQVADDCLKEIKFKLYAYNLIPDASGDILELSDSLDDLVDSANHTLQHLSIEQPQFPPFAKEAFLELSKVSCQAVEELLKGVRSFLENTGMVEEYVTKVYFYESEADKQEDALARLVFQSQEISRLSHKMHLRYFIQQVASLSDIAEGVALRLSVYQLKRKL